ncbi:monocarboxylate uptake permease MctP [Sulfobacillus sp. hq2]|uniref:monocarboxylate uptake permease MctP n=1 Tax=Sulfobacillus TaxID=28033 RepID=UPI000CD308E4|nr:sodium:solute symporter [Sulfobacillus sp. hq2]POB11932.1 sodium:solute symporter [Sulfobacillus sp. hq2]
MYWSAFIVFLILFILVTVLGFYAGRWHRGDLDLIEEWGLAGRRFGTFVTWFLLGGDLYTAYTFIAVPALVYGAGAFGFFAVPYTIVVFPIMYIIMPRLWRVSKQRDYVTAADFVRGRFDSSLLALAVAITGILATMPYIALQLTGIQAVLAAMGLSGHGIMKDLPLIVAFLILAAYTYTSGLRAPALTAILKDLLIYVTVIVACIAIPMQLGGYGHIFHVAAQALPPKGSVILSPKLFSAFATLALGSAFALLLYPHAVTGTLGAKSGRTIQRNAALLPLYSLALTFIALLGYMAIAAGIHTTDTSLVVPLLFLKTLPTWFAGFAFGAIAIGALVPAAIMAIAAANLFTRNIYREYFAAANGPNREAQVAKIVGLIVIIGALFFIVVIPLQYAIYFQTLGGIWILQTVPAIMFGLYTRWFHRWALFLGWLAGMVVGTGMAAAESFKTSLYPLHLGHSVILGYAGIWAIIVNIVLTFVLTLIFNAMHVSNGRDETKEADYTTEPA